MSKAVRTATFAVAGLALALAACGGASRAATAAGDEKTAEDRMLEFTQCLRENGIDVKQQGGRGGPAIVAAQPASGMGQKEFQEAHEKCEHLLPKGSFEDLTPEEKERMQDALLEFAQCMRAQGVEMDDPKNGALNFRFRGKPGAKPGVPQRLEPDPEFRAAQEKCKHLMPDGGRMRGGLRVEAGR